MHALPHAAPLLDAVFRAVLQASWQGALAIVLVLIIRRALGTRVPARWHYLLWFLVLVRLLAPTFLLPHGPASLANIQAVARPFGPQRPPLAEQKFSAGQSVAMPPALPVSLRVGPPRAPVTAISAAAGRRWSWPTFAALAWLVGAVSLGGWLALCSWNLRRRVRRETFPADADLAALWQTCCRRWLRRPAPPILLAAWVHSPALVGAWRPTLLLPRQTAAAFSTQDWEHIFAHEIAHLRWRDQWTQLLVLAAWCLHWFNPVVWLGFRRLRSDRELAADEWVLKHLEGERALAYGETLFKTVANRPAYPGFQPGLIGISEDGAQLKQRLRRIAAFLPGQRLVGSLAGSGILLVLATVVLGQGAATPGPAPTAAPAKTAAEQAAATPAPPSMEQLTALSQRFRDDLLAAARAGDGKALDALVETAWKPQGKFDQQAAHGMINDALRAQDLTAFTALSDALTKSNLGKDWKPEDAQLASLVKAGRTDFLDVLLARRLDLARLAALASSADAPTAGWIARRVSDEGQRRADVQALGHAARDNDLPTLRRLLDAGVDLNAVDNEDNTALIEAVFKNRLEAARLLLERGAEVDKVRFPGWDYTPLCLVTSAEMAQLLKDHGANLHATLFKRDANILTYVAMWQGADVVKWFLQQGLDPKMVGDNDESLLFGAGDPKTVKLLLDLGVGPNRPDQFGMPPLSQARSAAVAQALIDGGAKLTGFKRPLLPDMIQRGSGDAIEAVFKAGAERDPETLQKWLIQAAHVDNEGAAKVLLKYGAKPNDPGIFSSPDDRMLPLEASAVWGGEKVAKVLLDAGADPNGNKKWPGGLLGNAMKNGHREVAKLLRAAGAKSASDLSFALAIHDQNQVKALLATAPTYAENPAFWQGGLPSAAQVGDVETVRAALAKGVPVEADASPDFKHLAYEAAAGEGQDEVLAILLATRKPGANPAELRWALWDAVWNCHPYDKQRSVAHFERCVEMLLAAGAPLTGYEEERNLMVSAVFSRNPGGNPKVMEMLARAGVEPNPMVPNEDHSQSHLLDAVQDACKKGYCSAPIAETLAKLIQLAPAPPAGGPAAPPTPGPEPAPEKAEPPPAAPPATSGRSIDAVGHVSMADGTPPGGERITTRLYSTRGQGGSIVAAEHVENGVFPVWLDEQTTGATLAVEQAGCAPVYVGPFDVANLDRLANVEVKLERGYPATVQIVDAAGRPVAGARLRPYHPGPPVITLPEAVTDANGNATLEHLGQAPLNLRLLADGFQGDEAVGLHLDPARPYRWALTPAAPLPGTVLTAGTGQPVADAVIKLAGVRGPHNEEHYDPRQAPVLTNADAQGRFVLPSLRPDSRYYLFVEAPGYGGVFLRGVKLDQGRLDVTLGPELTIQGRIMHAPPSVMHLGKVYLQYGQRFEVGENTSGFAGKSADLVPVNGEAAFKIGPFYKVVEASIAEPKEPARWGGKAVSIYVDTWGQAGFSPDELPATNYVFDLAEKSNDRDASATDAKPASTKGEEAAKQKSVPAASS